MGCYMNGFGEEATGKAKCLVELGAKPTTPGFIDPSTGEVAVCVVANPMFEAVGVAYKAEEAEEFANTRNDPRPRTWLRMSTELVSQFSPLEQYLSE